MINHPEYTFFAAYLSNKVGSPQGKCLLAGRWCWWQTAARVAVEMMQADDTKTVSVLDSGALTVGFPRVSSTATCGDKTAHSTPRLLASSSGMLERGELA